MSRCQAEWFGDGTHRRGTVGRDGNVGTPSVAVLAPVSGRQAIEATAEMLPASLIPRPLAEGAEIRR